MVRLMAIISAIVLFIMASIIEAAITAAFGTRTASSKSESERASEYSAKLLRALGFRIHVRIATQDRTMLQTPSLIVSNHLGFWDVLVLSSLFSPRFVTSYEVRDSFLIGRLAKFAGCIFVERRNRSTVQQNVEEISACLKRGENVVVFPEATSTDGSSVLPFKRSLFQAAIEAGRPVLPICLNYRSIDDMPVSKENRDELFYYGDHTFFSQLIKIASRRDIVVELVVLDSLPARNAQSPADLAVNAHQLISNYFEPIS